MPVDRLRSRSSSVIAGLLVCLGASLSACASQAVAPPEVSDTWSPPEVADAYAPDTCEESLALFAYDSHAPLDIRETRLREDEGVSILDLTYASPKGGRVPATLVVPEGSGPFAGLLYQHGMPATRGTLLPGAVTFARMGAIVLLIDAPFARRPGGLDEPITFTEQDRHEQIQLITDLRRGVDLLLARPEVDPERLAYVGISYGGAMGGLLAGVEHRIKAYVLQVGDGGLVTHVTGPEDRSWWMSKPEQARQDWVAWMWPIEPIHYVRCAAPAALLFQNGTADAAVPPADALRYQEAGSDPKTVRWYEAGHGLPAAAARDQARWLSQAIGITSRRLLPRGANLLLTAWSLSVVVSFGLAAFDLWRTRPAPHGARMVWLLAIGFLGPVGLLAYWISGRQPAGGRLEDRASPARRALGSASWATAGNLLGGIGVVALLLYLPLVFDMFLALKVAVTFFIPFSVGGLTLAVSRWLSRSDPVYQASYRHPMFAEAVSTCLVLTGAFPVVNLVSQRWLTPWAAPFGFDLFHLPLWGALCLAAVVGAIVTYPFHLWMILRDVIAWGQPASAPTRDLNWYGKGVLILLTFAVMLAAIFASTQFA